MFTCKKVLLLLLPAAVVGPWALAGATRAEPPHTFVEEGLVATESYEDYLGAAVAIDGDTLLAAPGWNDYVEVFVRDASGSWQQDYLQSYQRLAASDATTEICTDPVYHVCHHDGFGMDLAISGDTLVIGAPWNKVAGEDAGAAYVYVRDSTGLWALDRRLDPPVPGPFNEFGVAVDIEGNKILVGARGAYDGAGAVYVYKHQRRAWRLVQTIVGNGSDGLGADLVLDGNRFLVSAAGRAFVFKRGKGGVWSQSAELDVGALPQYAFQYLALDGPRAAVGEAGQTRTVAVFRKAGQAWRRVQTLESPVPTGENSDFGEAVSLLGNVLAIGDPEAREDSECPGLTHVYDFAGGQWVHRQTLAMEEGCWGYASLGYALAMDGARLAVGAPYYRAEGAIMVYREVPAMMKDGRLK